MPKRRVEIKIKEEDGIHYKPIYEFMNENDIGIGDVLVIKVVAADDQVISSNEYIREKESSF